MKSRSLTISWWMTYTIAYTIANAYANVSFQSIATSLPTPASADIPVFDFSIYSLCNSATPTTPAKQTPLPELAETFTIGVERKRGETVYFGADGHFDKNGQRGATIIRQAGTKTSYLYDFITGNAFRVVEEDDEHGGRQCRKEDLWQTGCSNYAYFMAELVGYSVVSSKCNISASNVTDQGVQHATVRDIRVQMWEQCVHDNKRNTVWRNRYYYTAPGAKPVRLESMQLDGPDVGKMQVYDFTYYYPEVKDKSVFLPGPGVYCPGWEREKQDAPTLPDQFSLTALTVSKNDQAVYSLNMHLDSKHLFVAYFTDSLSGTPSSAVKPRTQYRTIHDYTSGLSVTMPVWGTWQRDRSECTVSAIDTHSLDSIKSDSWAVVHLKSARDLFAWNRSGALYVGQRDFNGMPTNVWVSQRSNNDPTNNITTTMETYWLHENWTSSGSRERPLVGISVCRAFPNGTIFETLQNTVSDFSPFPVTWKPFAVADCLRDEEEMAITFGLKVQNDTEVEIQKPAFEVEMRDALSRLTGASPLQFSDIRVMRNSIWVKVSDWVNNTGSEANATHYPNVTQVVDGLRKLMDGQDAPYTIQFANRTQSMVFLKDSIQIATYIMKSTTTPIRPPTPPTTPRPTETPTAVAHGYNAAAAAPLSNTTSSKLMSFSFPFSVL
ncbi:uncharacterized protein LOC129592430 [Paramacrobiotus metropolitanus]|uniref:uncharacterized protein LOC129592430 n=1 Tax=Paramacrobiotus metropolitanus TaxID=2943436 RepID=UPI002445A379|nr:uncharacterized protein LOC129592430 [Paramacrobiotus metropolitanus]